MNEVFIAGTGAYVPEHVLGNAELERMVDTSDEWIVQRTGIRERRISAPSQATSDLAVAAARKALADAGVAAEDIDGIFLATISSDSPVPATAVHVQEILGARNAFALDINAACTGFVYAVGLAAAMIRGGMSRKVLAIGAESLSRIIDYTDRNSCILFGDGAGAAVVALAPASPPQSPRGDGASPPQSPRGDGGDDKRSRIIDTYLRSDGSMKDFISLPAGGSRKPASAETVAAREHFLRMSGKDVFKFATKALVELVERALERNGFRVQDLDLVIPHQVNYRIIESAQKKLDLPLEKFFLNLERYGNTSAASVPIALDEAIRCGRLRRGNLVLFVAFGAGMTWGYNLIRW
jgi:3-oxoacyl-[acyl-carrier-protein] synthase-3